jgi:hypothetical protein
MKTPLVFWSTMKIVTMIFSKGLGIACHALCINYKYSYQYAYTVKPIEIRIIRFPSHVRAVKIAGAFFSTYQVALSSRKGWAVMHCINYK